MSMIARAADGSVRDGLSLLDRGIALCDGEAGITAAQVEDMLGLADRARNLDLLEKALGGDMPGALDIMDGLYRSGADPIVMMQDLLTLTHVLTKCRAVPETQSTGQVLAAGEMVRASEMAAALSMPSLAKAWQILLKGLSEVQAAPNPQAAAEMVLIRLVYAANLPDPADLVKRLKDSGAPMASGGAATASQGASAVAAQSVAQHAPEGAPVARLGGDAPRGGVPHGAPALAVVPDAPAPVTYIQTLQDAVAVLEQGNAMLLASNVVQYVHLVKLENKGDSGRLEINLDEMAPPKLAQDLGQTLSKFTEQRWVVSVVSAQGAATLAQVDRAEAEAERNNIWQMPIMKAVFEAFPDAEFTKIKREPVHVPAPIIDEEEG
jgi:DNA polymerase-3 subunit gamma/tau